MTDDRTLSFDRLIAAKPETVWRCWTDPDLLARWFAPKPVKTTITLLDVRPGGGFGTRMEVPDHGVMEGDAGCFLVVEPNRRLVWTNALGPEFRPNHIGTGEMEFPFTAEIRMEPEGDGTRYTSTAYHPTPESAATHDRLGFYDGWGTAATQLQELAESL